MSKRQAAKGIKKPISRLLRRPMYNADDFYTSLNKIIVTTSDLRGLLERMAYLLKDTFQARQVLFFTYHDDGRYVSDGTDGHARLTLAEAHEFDALFVKRGRASLLRTSLTPDSSIRRLMTSHRLALVMPLYKERTIIGYLYLGDRRQGAYRPRDLKVLQTIADELVVAIQNAQSVQEVKALNAHLEQRISEATKELRASNVKLQKLDEAKDEFISMASHQLRTPLTSIKGYLSMIIEGDVGDITPEQKHMLSEAFVSSERMVRLIGDFLNVSRLQTGKFVIEKRPVDLAKLVGREIDALASNAAARGIKFSYEAPKDVPKIELDENKIQQVIMNFADNAIFYSKDGSKIAVKLEKTARHVAFTVTDTGIGVPKAEQAKLFTKFFRATNARTARPDGTGVGLFLAKTVVEDHGGSIIFESKEGKGSTFGFKLPLPKEDSAKK